MIVIGLTGSIGMGKTTTANMLEGLGVPVHDADSAVHEMLSDKRGQAYTAVCAAFPYFEYPQIYKDRVIQRKALGEVIFSNDEAREKLEGILHPLVRVHQDKFVRTQKRMGRKIVALDIPLLFETGSDGRCDVTVVASAPYHVQRQRVMARAGMTEDKFHAILNRQMIDADKCALADFVIKTGLGRAYALGQIKAILREYPL